MQPLYYTPKEVAALLNVSDDTVLGLIETGDLPALRVSPRIIRIPIVAFDLWREGFRPRRRQVAIREATGPTEFGAGEELPGAIRSLRR
jgi:excisionase family DNA binding protein